MAALNGVQVSFSTAGPVGTTGSNIGLRAETTAGQGMTGSSGTSTASAPTTPAVATIVTIVNTLTTGIFYTYGVSPADPTSLAAPRDYLAAGQREDRFCQRGSVVRWVADA